YATGESNERISKLPQTEMVKEKGYEILYFTEDVDEFAIRMLMNYQEKEFKNISSGDLDLETEEEKKEAEKEAEAHKELLDKMREALSGKVKDVKATNRLLYHHIFVPQEGEVVVEMEQQLQNVPAKQQVTAHMILAGNVNHDVYQALQKANENGDTEKVTLYTILLYQQAKL